MMDVGICMAWYTWVYVHTIRAQHANLRTCAVIVGYVHLVHVHIYFTCAISKKHIIAFIVII